ncbi:hypothetical protein B0O99DRAFT_726784 [Bisporella sp. PMI_857]|nr:hypothetical protein B0O99DRAFT_726784 [Bisporella sp. PMI_857]
MCEIIPLLIEVRYSHVITPLPTVAYRCLPVPTGAYNRLELASLLEQEPHAALVDTPRNDRFIKQTAVAVFGTESLAPIERFTQIPWFRRRWIIQEASLCPVSVVFFGKSMSALSVLSVAMAALWNSTVITHKVNQDALHAILVINHIGNCRERWPGEELAHGIVDLLVACHASESSEHRDRLYALLSVAPDVKKTRNHSGNGWTDINVRVDYKQPLRKLYSDFAHQCLRISPTLDVLHCAGAFISNDPPHRQYSTQYGLMTFPSFVPDWRAQRRYMPFMGVHRFTAGFGDNAPFNEYDRILDDLVLSLPGLQLDKVKIKSDPVLEPLLTEKQVNTLFRSYFSLYRQYLVSKGEEANKKFPLEALAKTLIADHALSDSTILLKGGVNEQGQLRGRDSVKTEIARKALWGGFLSLLKAPGVAESSDKDGLLALNYLKAVCETMQGRCFFILESGHMGIGPSHMEVGDLVVVFFGVRTPFVLHVDVPDPIPRKVQYRLVGDCYVDGFMNGEVFRLPGVKSSSYVIC